MKTLTSERIKKARLNHHLTQEGLGNLLNLSKQTISNYESGARHPGIEYIRKIATAFEIDVNYLMGIKDIMGGIEKENIMLKEKLFIYRKKWDLFHQIFIEIDTKKSRKNNL
jgi:transcriptional regulator with XRE-family HTH domain